MVSSKSKLAGDILTGASQRRNIVDTYINPYLRNIGSKLRLVPSLRKKSLAYYLTALDRGVLGVKVHLRRSDLRLFLKMPSRKTNPDEFLDAERDSLFVFYQVRKGRPTGRFGNSAPSVQEVRNTPHVKRVVGRIKNENSIDFVGFSLRSVTYMNLGESKGGLVGFDLIEALIDAFNRQFPVEVG